MVLAVGGGLAPTAPSWLRRAVLLQSETGRCNVVIVLQIQQVNTSNGIRSHCFRSMIIVLNY